MFSTMLSPDHRRFLITICILILANFSVKLSKSYIISFSLLSKLKNSNIWFQNSSRNDWKNNVWFVGIGSEAG